MSVTSVFSSTNLNEPAEFFAQAQYCDLGDETTKQEYLNKLNKMMRGLYKAYAGSSKIDNKVLLQDLANTIVKVAHRDVKVFLKTEHDFSCLKFKRWAWVSLVLNLQSFAMLIISGAQDFFYNPKTEKGEVQISPMTIFGALSILATYLSLGFNLIKSEDNSSDQQLKNKLFNVLSTSLLPDRKIDVKKDHNLYNFLSKILEKNYEPRME